jgi:uncharacterized protein YigA (DUF484 family)
MSQDAEELRSPSEVIAEDAVAAYLRAHPEFFQRHRDLVAGLKVPHASGEAVSLIEHQVGVLRGQLETERRRLAHLIARAREFETLAARLHDLFLQLIAAPDLERIQTVLREALCREFNAEAVDLKLFPIQPDADDDTTLSTFLEVVDRGHSLCGPLDPVRNGAIFGEHSERIHSAALIPVRGDGHSGVLAIGSSDPERFRPDMGTDLLDRLGEIVSQKLRVLHTFHG